MRAQRVGVAPSRRPFFTAGYKLALLTGGRRPSPRAPVSLDARIGRGSIDRTLCMVSDRSRHGARIQTRSALRRNALIWLTLPGLRQRAIRTLRADDFEAGCQFEEPLSQQQFGGLTSD
jgi:hypothetical protein